MPHNHPPRCCCENTIGKQVDGARITDPEQVCPSCTIHGELAQLADNECPSCHQLPGRPPTDYCQRPDWHEHRGIVGRPETYLDGPKTLTTQPATRTTTPPTQTRDPIRWPQPALCGSSVPHDGHRWIEGNRGRECPGLDSEPTPLATPTPPALDETWHFPPSGTEWPANPDPHPATQCTPDCRPPCIP